MATKPNIYLKPLWVGT